MDVQAKLTTGAVGLMGVMSVGGVIVLAALQRDIPTVLNQLGIASLAGLAGIAVPGRTPPPPPPPPHG